METNERRTGQQLRNAYDAEMKNILTNKRVLANILIGCTDEFANCDVEDVINKSFDTEPIYGDATVEEDTQISELAAKVIAGEHATFTEGKVVYDTRFEVRVPNTDTPIELIVNVEGQRNTNLPYDLTRRGIYYSARLITSQKGSVFKNDDYNALKKVYSIWICTSPPPDARGTCQRYALCKEDFIGLYNVDPKQYDLMTVVVLWVGDSTDPNYNNRLMRMLSLFFRAEIPLEQTHQILTDEYGFQKTFLAEEVQMKSWAREIDNEGYERGVKQGLELGIKQGINQGENRGLAKGKAEGMCDAVKRFMVSMNKSLEDTMAILQLTDDEKHSIRACFVS